MPVDHTKTPRKRRRSTESPRPPEDSQETREDIETPSKRATQAVLAATDWTAQTLLDQLGRGNIELNPRFQRRDAWKAPRKSLFIESLILGYPVPQLVLAERKEKRGSYIVIDGKQRLLALRQFSASEIDDEFKSLKLTGLKVRSDLNGLRYTDFEDSAELEIDLTALQNQTVRTVVIRNWQEEEFLYSVFL